MSFTIRKAVHQLVSELDPNDKMDLDNIAVPLSHNKFLFADALRKKLRGVEFYKCEEKTNSLWVVHPDDVYAMGYIGYGDITKTTNERKYYIYCRTISNDKYNTYDDYHFMKMRSGIDAAVRVACQHLRPYTPIERVSVDSKTVNDVIDTYRGEFGRAETRGRRAIIGSTSHESDENDLFNELHRAIEQGYQPTDLTLIDKIRDWRKAYDAQQSIRKESLPATFVLHNTDNTFTMGKINNLSEFAFTPARDVPIETVQSLPEDIEGKVAVLSMVDPDHYVAGVGVRLDSGAFYVINQ
ncbi:MAG: hypothetical protein VW683_14745 [Betaproteobacteria bacterium]